MSVIELKRPEPRIWVCGCGCSTFSLLDNDTARCANCEALVDGGAWYEEIKDGPERDPDLDTPIAEVQGNGSVDFVRRSLGRKANRDDAALIIVAFDDGAVSVWCAAQDRQQTEWALERIDQARDIVDQRGDGDG